MDFHRLRLLKFNQSIPTKISSTKQNILKRETVQKCNREKQKRIKKSKSVTKFANIFCDKAENKSKERSLNRKSKSDTVMMRSLHSIMNNLGQRKTMSLGDIKKRLKKKVCFNRISQTISRSGTPNKINITGKFNNAENSKEIKTLFPASKPSSSSSNKLFSFRKNYRMFDLYTCKKASETECCNVTEREPRMKANEVRARQKCNVCNHKPFKQPKMKCTKSDNRISYNFGHFNVVRFPTRSNVKLRTPRSVRLYQIDSDTEDMDLCEICRQALASLNLRLPSQPRTQQNMTQWQPTHNGNATCLTCEQAEDVTLCDAETLTNIQTELNVIDRATSTCKDMVRSPCCTTPLESKQLQIGKCSLSAPTIYKHTKRRMYTVESSSKSNQKKKCKLGRKNKNKFVMSTFAKFASSVFQKLHKLYLFFTKHPFTGRRVLKFILFCVIVLVWSPCIIVVGFSWCLSYPLKPHHLSNENNKQEKKKYINDSNDKKYKTIWANFIGWVKEFSHSRMYSDKKTRSVLESIKEMRCKKFKKKLNMLPKTRFRTHMRPNPQRKYTFFHANRRGCEIKPIRDDMCEQYTFRQHFQNMFFRCNQFKVPNTKKNKNEPTDSCKILKQQASSGSPLSRGVKSAQDSQFLMWLPSENRTDTLRSKMYSGCNFGAQTDVLYTMPHGKDDLPKVVDDQHDLKSNFPNISIEHQLVHHCKNCRAVISSEKLKLRSTPNRKDNFHKIINERHQSNIKCKKEVGRKNYSCLSSLHKSPNIDQRPKTQCILEIFDNYRGSRPVCACKKCIHKISNNNRGSKIKSPDVQQQPKTQCDCIHEVFIDHRGSRPVCACKNCTLKISDENHGSRLKTPDIQQQPKTQRDCIHEVSENHHGICPCKKIIHKIPRDSKPICNLCKKNIDPHGSMPLCVLCKEHVHDTAKEPPMKNVHEKHQSIAQRGRSKTRDHKLLPKKSSSAVDLNKPEEVKHISSRSHSEPKRLPARLGIIQSRRRHVVVDNGVLHSGCQTEFSVGDNLLTQPKNVQTQHNIMNRICQTKSYPVDNVHVKSYPKRSGSKCFNVGPPITRSRKINTSRSTCLHNCDRSVKKKLNKISHNIKSVQSPREFACDKIQCEKRSKDEKKSANKKKSAGKKMLTNKKKSAGKKKSANIKKTRFEFESLFQRYPFLQHIRNAFRNLNRVIHDVESEVWKDEVKCNDGKYLSNGKKRPFFFLYRHCPWCYPLFVKCRNLCCGVSNQTLLCLAVCTWLPFICACYFCYLCCRLCSA